MAAAGASGLYVNPNTGAAQAGLAPFRNAIINGDFRINQRGTSSNLASLTAIATAEQLSWVTDRWNVLRGSYVAGGVMGQGTNLTMSDLPFADVGLKTFGRLGRLNNNAATDPVYLTYNIESQDCYRFIGKTVTLSFYYRTGANFSGTNLTGVIYTGTGTDQALRGGYTGQAAAGLTNCNANTSWQRVSLTRTLGTAINQIGFIFQYTPVGTAGAADYFDVTGVQLELGSVATPFEVRPYSVELQMCLRYLCVFKSTSNKYISLGLAVGQSTTIARAIINLPVPLRSVTPTIILNNVSILWGSNAAFGGLLRVWNGTTYVPTSAQTNLAYIIPENTTAFYFELIFASGITAGVSYNIFMEVGNNFLYIDAEL
jgi:hypothetical protein